MSTRGGPVLRPEGAAGARCRGQVHTTPALLGLTLRHSTTGVSVTGAPGRHDRQERAKRGALLGLIAGVVLAVLGDVGAVIVRNTAYMADVLIVGYTAVFGAPASVVLGAVLGWWGRPRHTMWLAAAAAVPAGLVAFAHVGLQALSV